MDAVAFLPASEQAELIRAGELSPVDLVETYLGRIERLDPQLNAYVTVRAEEALAEALAAQEAVGREATLPPFHGVPIPIKDLTATAGVRTTFSSRAFADYVPVVDAAVVRRLKEAGFIVIGKTNTPEFGTTAVTESELNGDCRNPWDTSLTPGGSSGGAAAALAAGLCPVAHGSDGGGSIRIPASCCGVFGLKPSRGRVSDAPFPSVTGLGTSGPIARSVADAAALLDVIAGYEPGDPYRATPPERPYTSEVGVSPGSLRIGLTTAPPRAAGVHPDCVTAVEDAADLLTALGHEVEEAAPDWFDPELMDSFAIVWQPGPALYGVSDRSLLTQLNRWLLERGLETPSVDYAFAVAKLQTFGRRVVPFWERYDLLLTPTLALPPVPIGWTAEDPDPEAQFRRAGRFTPFTPVANVTGQPAVSLPLFWSENGLPIGVHLIGPPEGEALLLRVSAQLEEARPWRNRRPPVS